MSIDTDIIFDFPEDDVGLMLLSQSEAFKNFRVDQVFTDPKTTPGADISRRSGVCSRVLSAKFQILIFLPGILNLFHFPPFIML